MANPVLSADILQEAVPGNIRKAEHFVAFLKKVLSCFSFLLFFLLFFFFCHFVCFVVICCYFSYLFLLLVTIFFYVKDYYISKRILLSCCFSCYFTCHFLINIYFFDSACTGSTLFEDVFTRRKASGEQDPSSLPIRAAREVWAGEEGAEIHVF